MRQILQITKQEAVEAITQWLSRRNKRVVGQSMKWYAGSIESFVEVDAEDVVPKEAPLPAGTEPGEPSSTDRWNEIQ